MKNYQITYLSRNGDEATEVLSAENEEAARREAESLYNDILDIRPVGGLSETVLVVLVLVAIVGIFALVKLLK